MKVLQIISIGLDEDQRPMLDTQAGLLVQLSDFLQQTVTLDNILEVVQKEITDYGIFGKEEKSVEEALQEMKDNAEFSNWDDGSIEKEFSRLCDQFKQEINGKNYQLFGWAIEYDNNLLAVITE
jgi:hypothetical protein